MSSGKEAGSAEYAGWVTKRGTRFPSWKDRWLSVDEGKLEWRARPTDAHPIKALDLREASGVERAGKEECGRDGCCAVVTKKRTLFFCGRTEEETTAWVRFLRSAVRKIGGGGGGEGKDRAAEEEKARVKEVVGEKVVLRGFVEEGTELSVVRGDGLAWDMERVVISWFWARGREEGDRVVELVREKGVGAVEEVEGVGWVGGSGGATFTPGKGEVGKVVGCVVTASGTRGKIGRGVVSVGVVKELDTSVLSVRIRIHPHKHSKFCDRRIRVCTAPGKYREGEVMWADLQGPSPPPGAKILWERSKPVHRLGLTFEDTDMESVEEEGESEEEEEGEAKDGKAAGGGGSGGRGAGGGSGGGGSATTSFSSSSSSLAPLRAPSSPITLASSSSSPLLVPHASLVSMGSESYGVVKARPRSHLLPTPEQFESDPPLEEILRATGGREGGVREGAKEYAMFSDDVNRMIRVRVVDGEGKTLATSPPIGPVEPAPPCIRAVWIEGIAVVGEKLVGKYMYFGGPEGESKAWWMRVDPEGNSEIVQGPDHVNSASSISSSADLSSAYTLLPRDLGCRFKFRVEPVRADGDTGHVTASKPFGPAKETQDEDPMRAFYTREATEAGGGSSRFHEQAADWSVWKAQSDEEAVF